MCDGGYIMEEQTFYVDNGFSKRRSNFDIYFEYFLYSLSIIPIMAFFKIFIL